MILSCCGIHMTHYFIFLAVAAFLSMTATAPATTAAAAGIPLLPPSSMVNSSSFIAHAIQYGNYNGDFSNSSVDGTANNELRSTSSLRRMRRRRHLLDMSSTLTNDEHQADESSSGGGVIINMMRRAKDHVSPTDVPFLLLLQIIPAHSNDIIPSASEAMYNIMTQCYGLIGQRFDDNDDNVGALLEAKRNNIVDKYFLSADYYFGGGVVGPQHQQQHYHQQSDLMAINSNTAQRKLSLQQRQQPIQQPFHFLATHHYQEGAALFTPKHRGRVIAILEHPVIMVQKNFLSSKSSSLHTSSALSSTNQQQQQHDDLIEQLIQYVNSTNYIDNTMTRMISNIPFPIPLTEEHFKYARMIVENKFLIGMGYDMEETLYKRIKLYFGWRELKEKSGCEAEILKSLLVSSKMNNNDATSSSSTVLVEEGSKIWRFIQRKNLYDMKLYARGMSVFADQKMRLPVHYSVRQREVAAVQEAFFDGGNLRSVEEYRDASDIPFFWHIPKASGTTVKEILSDCYGLIRTEMIQPPSSLDVFHDKHVLNLDLSTPESIAVAKRLKVADRGLADVFISQLSLEGSTVFSKSYHSGRAFTILRHPVKLAASLFYYRRIATWEPTYRPEYINITLQEYVETNGYYDNWMVRMLSNAKLGGLNDSHLELAKRILKEKFVIGISDHMDETFRMLQVYYGWVETRGGCVNFHLHSAPSNKNKYPSPENGGPVWAIIAEKNKYDMALYYYALELFGDQSEKLIFREG